MNDFVDVYIEIKGCDSIDLSSDQTIDEFAVQLKQGTNDQVQWDEFVFAEAFCVVDTYIWSCDGPFTDDTLTDTAGGYNSTDPLCDTTFSIDDSAESRNISEQFAGLSNDYEGVYVITIEGYNSVYPGNSKTTQLFWNAGADCSDSSIEINGPTTIFSNP